MRIMTFLCLASLFCAAAWADDDTDRAKLMGSWQMEENTGDAAAWSFSREGKAVKVTQTESGSKVADFVCGTDGSPCEVKTGGKKATVSIWFNGPKMVELERKGADVVERRFAIEPAGDQMELEVVQMVPTGKTEKIKFKRASK